MEIAAPSNVAEKVITLPQKVWTIGVVVTTKVPTLQIFFGEEEEPSKSMYF